MLIRNEPIIFLDMSITLRRRHKTAYMDNKYDPFTWSKVHTLIHVTATVTEGSRRAHVTIRFGRCLNAVLDVSIEAYAPHTLIALFIKCRHSFLLQSIAILAGSDSLPNFELHRLWAYGWN